MKHRTKAQTSAIMRHVKSKDSAPELALRKALWARGARYRLHAKNLPGRPDVFFPSVRVAVFIDGDFWHGNQWQRRGYACLSDQFSESDSSDYWVGKIGGNTARDRYNTRALLAAGWTVLRFWESDLLAAPEVYAEQTLNAIAGYRDPSALGHVADQTVAEFFAGIGLVRLGLEAGGWNVVFANDIDPEKEEMYSANFEGPDGHLVRGDVHDLHAEQIPTVTLATASFPCNDLSLAGAMRGLNGKHSSAFWGFISVIERMRERKPPIIMLENVTGWLRSAGGEDFAQCLLALNRLGYACDAFAIDAVSFVPQSRPRLFVIGRLGTDHTSVPALIGSHARPQGLVSFILRHPDIRWHIRPLPSLPARTVQLEDILEDLPDDSPEWWSDQRASYFLNQMSERHSETAHRMIAADKYSYGAAFRRVRHGKSMAELRVDGLAGCLRTPRGGSGRQILLKAGHGRYFVRLFTPRECARLQGAPDTYRIGVPQNQALMGFGDAVCVPVIEWIAEHYLNSLVTEMSHGRVLCNGDNHG